MTSFYEEDPRRFKLILKALKDFHLDIAPSGALEHVAEAENFWRKLWQEYPGVDEDADRIAWIATQVPLYYRSFGEPPRWIQNHDWPFSGGFPMIFVEQIDVARTADNLAGKFFHDDVSYYVFVPSYDLMDKTRQHYYPERLVFQRW